MIRTTKKPLLFWAPVYSLYKRIEQALLCPGLITRHAKRLCLYLPKDQSVSLKQVHVPGLANLTSWLPLVSIATPSAVE